MKILVILFVAGAVLAVVYFLSWKENPLRNIITLVFIALLIAFFLWLYGYGHLFKMLFGIQ
jgi:hypothetical protein